MTKQELEKAIEKGESVWLVFEDRIYKLDKSKIIDINDCYVEYYNNYYRCNLYATISDFYETEARAKHFISHCGVTRTETLPFLTWEEFKEKRELKFNSVDGIYCELFILNDFIYLQVGKDITENSKQQNVGEAIEENFYRAYDECVRLFNGEE